MSGSREGTWPEKASGPQGHLANKERLALVECLALKGILFIIESAREEHLAQGRASGPT